MEPKFLKPEEMKCIMVMNGVYANPLYLDDQLMILRMQVYEDVPIPAMRIFRSVSWSMERVSS